MKTFYAALAVFALLLAAVFINTAHVCRVTAELQEELSSFSDAESALTAVTELWQKERDILALSKPMDCVWEVDRCLLELEKAVQKRDAAEVDAALRAVSNAVARIRYIEGLRPCP